MEDGRERGRGKELEDSSEYIGLVEGTGLPGLPGVDKQRKAASLGRKALPASKEEESELGLLGSLTNGTGHWSGSPM